MCSVSSLCETTRPRWCIRYESTRNSWLVSLTGAPSSVTRAIRGSSATRAAAQLGRDLPARAANQGAQPREQFLHPERLDDVVVRAAVDPLHLLVPAAARGQDHDRHGETRLAPAPQQRQPVDLRQSEVEDDGVVAFGLAEKIGAFAVRGAVHGVAGRAERARRAVRPAAPRLRRPALARARPPSLCRYSAPDAERLLNNTFTPRSGGSRQYRRGTRYSPRKEQT